MADDRLSAQERRDAQAIFRGEIQGKSGCMHCAGIHDVVFGLAFWRQPCPRVKSATYHQDGVTLLSVEYWPPGWDAGMDIIYPHDVWDEIDAEPEDEVPTEP